MKNISFCTVVIAACSLSDIEQTSSGEVSSVDNSTSDKPEDSLGEESEELNTEPTEEETKVTLDSGTWIVSEAILLEDVCDWDNQIRSFFGMGTEALLPSDFTVNGSLGSFDIEANSFGAAGPILCTIEDDTWEFSCETQSVVPNRYDLGTMGWTYAIEFSGSIQDETSLEGEAFVSFPSMPEFMAPLFDAMGMNVYECTQTFSLSLVHE